MPGLDFEEEATAINNDGDVGGQFRSEGTGAIHSFLWSPETGFVDLGTLTGGDTFVTAINDRDGGDIQITGYADTSGGDRAWKYDTATGTMQDLGLLRGSSGFSEGWDINNAGDVAGVSSRYSKVRGFVFSNNMQDVGTLGGKHSFAYGINDFGDVVGTADTSNKSRKNKHQAYMKTSANGRFKLEPQITNLPASMELKVEPWRINNAGQIIGPGAIGLPNTAYLITPQ